MPRYRNQLPQLSDRIFITDGGIETTLIFHEGLELPDFAAFDLLKDAAGYEALRKYFQPYAALARSSHAGFILESATWRASSDWGAKLGYSARELTEMNRKAIDVLRDIRDEYETACRIAAACCSHSLVLPSMSVNRNVTVPLGKGMTEELVGARPAG